MKVLDAGGLVGLIALGIAGYYVAFHGAPMATAAQGFAGAGATLIGALQGRSVGTVG